ncbi:hypothetical protein J6590_086406 [Homalodisca vitripennis]|nr:hypothetical protein J6590_086406 [Homalodisca vitripennis]
MRKLDYKEFGTGKEQSGLYIRLTATAREGKCRGRSLSLSLAYFPTRQARCYEVYIEDSGINKPEIILDYNSTKSGVDIVDEMKELLDGHLRVRTQQQRIPTSVKLRLCEILGLPLTHPEKMVQENPSPGRGRCFLCDRKKNRPTRFKCGRCNQYVCLEHVKAYLCGEFNGRVMFEDVDEQMSAGVNYYGGKLRVHRRVNTFNADDTSSRHSHLFASQIFLLHFSLSFQVSSSSTCIFCSPLLSMSLCLVVSLQETMEGRRIQWMGHVKRMGDNRMPRIALEKEEGGRRPRGRPRGRWEDQVWIDIDIDIETFIDSK